MRSIFVSVICKAILLLTQHKRLCLSTKATNELSFKKKKKKIQAVNFLPHTPAVLLMPFFIVIVGVKRGLDLKTMMLKKQLQN